MTNLLRNTAVFLLAISLSGCGDQAQQVGDTVERPGEPPVTTVADDDQEMNAAIDQARATVDQFIQALEAPTPTQSDFSVKMLIKDDEHGEHMWIMPVRYEEGRFVGLVGNEPLDVSSVQFGDEVEVAKDQISDWMYVDEGVLQGGYTFRVLRNTLSPEEQAEFDSAMPFRME